jgi:small GTP-binding protein
MLLGDSGVGKSSVLLRLTDNKFDALEDINTVGIDYGLHSVHIDGHKVRIQIWDMAGQERFLPIALAYLDKVSVIVLMYDISARHTFEDIQNYWLPRIRSHITSRHIKIVLVGNKSDKFDMRQVSTIEANDFASQEHMWFYEISAYDGTYIHNIFQDVSRDILLDIHENVIVPADFVNMGISMDLHLSVPPQVTKADDIDKRKCWCVLS